MVFKIWQTVRIFWNQLNQQNILAVGGDVNMGISYTYKFQQSITNNLFISEATNDGDDFDSIIDTIFIPEPIDQPTPVEPVGQSDDD